MEVLHRKVLVFGQLFVKRLRSDLHSNFDVCAAMDCLTQTQHPIYFTFIWWFFPIASSYASCQTQLHRFLAFCAFIGLPMAPEKTSGPSTALSFTGIEQGTIKLEECLPPDKLQKSIELISKILRHKKVTAQNSIPSWLIKFCVHRHLPRPGILASTNRSHPRRPPLSSPY